MIKGIGVDIIEVQRIQKLIDKGQIALDLVFTINEQVYCKKKRNSILCWKICSKRSFFKSLRHWMD